MARVPEAANRAAATYRGWMLRSEQYAEMTAALASRNIVPLTSPAQYRQAHELPGWYPSLADVTPASVWTVGDGLDDFTHACAKLGPGPAVLRDYTKSMKHYWHGAVFIPDLADTATAWTVASRFRELRDDDFTGGFVLRRFERFVSAETRTWWTNGACRLIGPHPDTPSDDPPADLDLTAATNGQPHHGIPPVVAGMHFHDLRHTHKTWLIEDDIPEIAQAKRLGHRLPGVRGIYSHVTKAMQQRITQRLQHRWTATNQPQPDPGNADTGLAA